jgi:hypothetical protein
LADFKSDTSNEEALSVCQEQANKWKYCQGVSDESLNALSAGDRVWTSGVSVKSDGFKQFGAWIDVHSADGEWIEGKLAKDRDYGEDPILDQVIRVPKSRIWDISFEDPQKNELLRETPRRKYANYCLFDDRVGFDGPVQYVYRVEPCLTMEGDEAPDSGWRIKGDRRAFSIEVDDDTTRYTPLYLALYSDDSWLHLIDKPVGTAFKRDRKTGLFVEVKAPRSTLSPGEAELWRECM